MLSTCIPSLYSLLKFFFSGPHHPLPRSPHSALHAVLRSPHCCFTALLLLVCLLLPPLLLFLVQQGAAKGGRSNTGGDSDYDTRRLRQAGDRVGSQAEVVATPGGTWVGGGAGEKGVKWEAEEGLENKEIMEEKGGRMVRCEEEETRVVGELKEKRRPGSSSACTVDWSWLVVKRCLENPKEHLRNISDIADHAAQVCATMERMEKSWKQQLPLYKPFPTSLSTASCLPDLEKCTNSYPPFSNPVKHWSSARFLILAYTTEQLTKARLHLTEMVRLANITNRILVLPKASGSRLDIGRSLHPCHYFDLVALSRHVHWVTSDFYLSLSSRWIQPPSIKFLCLQSAKLQRHCYFNQDVAHIMPSILAISHGVHPNSSNTREVELPGGYSAAMDVMTSCSNFSSIVVINTTPSLLGIRPHAKSLAPLALPYSPHLLLTANLLKSRLGPSYMAVHFRFEHIVWIMGAQFKHRELTLHQIRQCSHSALSLLLNLTAVHRPSTLFLAHDLPSASAVGHSESWQATLAAHGSEEMLEAAVKELADIRRQIKSITVDEFDPVFAAADPGMVAIVDKLVCADADIFVAASLACGGMRSFDSDIVQLRNMMGKAKDKVIRWGSDSFDV